MSSIKVEKFSKAGEVSGARVGVLKNNFQQVTVGKQTIYYSYCGNFIIFEREGLYRITLDDNVADDTLKTKFKELPTQQLSGELNTVIETFKNLK